MKLPLPDHSEHPDSIGMLPPLDEQVADLEALQREIAALTEELDRMRPPSRAARCWALLRPCVPLAVGFGGVALVAAVGFGLYWVWTHLPPLSTPAPPAVVVVPTPGAGGIPEVDGSLSYLSGLHGLALVLCGIGLLGYLASLMDNPFASVLAGTRGFCVKAAILGGAALLLALLGFAL